MTDTRDIDIMRREIETIPDVVERQIRDQMPMIAELVQRLPGVASFGQEPPHVVLTGCGDSYFSGVATRLAFQEYGDVSARAIEALEFARYDVEGPANAAQRRVLIAVSYSGEVGRTIEAARAARAQGWHTIAITGRPDGRLAGVVDEVLLLDVPTLDTAPGTTTYVSLLVALSLTAAELAGARGRDDRRAELLAAVQAMPGLASQTLAMSASSSEALADVLADAALPTFLGAGPSRATAHFGAAKVFEGIQRPAIVEHLEEWAHLQYFASGPSMPTVVVAPDGPSLSRAEQLLAEMRFIETPGVLVTDRPDRGGPDVLIMPFATGAPEALSPLLSCLPIAYGVALLAARMSTSSYGFNSEEHEREHYETIHHLGPFED